MDIKPCPFCGGKGLLKWSTDREIAFVRCEHWGGDCMGASRNVFCDPQEKAEKIAIEEWNTRHITEGYVLVPIEPSQHMVDNVKAEWEGSRHIGHRIVQIYKAMVKAAQESNE